MRAHAAGVLLLFVGLIPLGVSCSREQALPPCPPPFLTNQKRHERLGACGRDADCKVGFCDREACAYFRGYEGYGERCTEPFSWPETSESSHKRPCGAYLCIDERCRSCTEDRECGKRSTCNHRRGWPGTSCTIDLSDDPDIPVSSGAAPPQVVPAQVCPKPVVQNLPDLPEEKRLTFGSPCAQDSDCRSGLCDRGTCGDPYMHGNYGRECVPGPSPPLSKAQEEGYLTPFGQNLCTGYLCLDRRCRSCKEDAECQWKGSGGPQCLHYEGWYGKRCGRPDEVKAHVKGEMILQAPAPSPPPPLLTPPGK